MLETMVFNEKEAFKQQRDSKLRDRLVFMVLT